MWVAVNRPAIFFRVSLKNVGVLSLFCFGINSAVVDTDFCKNCQSIFREFLSPLTHSGKYIRRAQVKVGLRLERCYSQR